MAAECWMFEESRNELVVFHLVNCLFLESSFPLSIDVSTLDGNVGAVRLLVVIGAHALTESKQ